MFGRATIMLGIGLHSSLSYSDKKYGKKFSMCKIQSKIRSVVQQRLHPVLGTRAVKILEAKSGTVKFGLFSLENVQIWDKIVQFDRLDLELN